MNHEQNAHLSPAAYRLLAVLTAAIGLVASAVTARFFVLGLERMESDSLAREALIAAGLLMIVVELAAFGLAALLPRQKLRGLRMQLMLIGLLLVSFEGVTIYVTQYLLVRGADAHSQGTDGHIRHLQATLAGQQQAAAALRANAERDGASPYAWIRQNGAATLREATALDARTAPLARELAQLQAERRPTLTDALGEPGMLAYSVARALLISVMGLVMFGASGALLRASRPSSRSSHPAAPTSATATGTAATAGTATGPAAATGSASGPAPHDFAHGQQATPAGASATVPYPSGWRRWAAAGVPIAAIPSAFATPTVTIEAPVMTATVTPPTVTLPAVTADTVTISAVTPGETVTISGVTPPTVTASATTGQPPRAKTVTASTATTRVRYERIRAGIEAGTITPSVRAVQAAEGGGTAEVRACLRRLEQDGILVRTGQGYARRRISDPNQIALAI